MNEEPIINAQLRKFQESFSYTKLNNDEAFERFANYSVLLQHQPDAFNADSELLDLISVGGAGDGGLDGIAIKVNGILIKTIDEIEDILKLEKVSIEFIFVQSKNKASFKVAELSTFIAGVRELFNPSSGFPYREEVLYWKKIIEFVYSDDVMCQWSVAPSVRCYYITYGTWNENPQHVSIVETFKKDMLEQCSVLNFHFLGVSEFRGILDRNANQFRVVLPCIDTMELPGVQNVENSCIMLCSASEFMRLLDTDEGIIKKSLFNDNVRDYQGLNSVNTEINTTISETPEKFVLFNNGVTIVCASFVNNNRKLVISNPQIVNGCQTCNVLFNAWKEGVDVNDVTLVVKVISTKDIELSNDVVRGTNRQSIVMDEAFETTKKFHKDLEAFMNDYVSEFPIKIYYERRAKQYAYNATIKQYQKINLKILTQYYVAIILRRPYYSHLHESVLLKKFEESIFNENDSKLPYFVIAYAFYTLEQLIHDGKIDKFYGSYKAHILMVYCKLLAGNAPDLKNDKMADAYANKILRDLYNTECYPLTFQKAIDLFNQANNLWVNKFHKSKHAMKDTISFTELLNFLLEGKSLDIWSNMISKQNIKCSGTISRIVVYGKNAYGFIHTDDGDDVYFCKRNNRNLNFRQIKGRRCTFLLNVEKGKERSQAFNVLIV